MSLSRGAPRLPDFIIIGAMKCGTTSLYHYLREHPEVFMPARKELDFFTQEINWPKGIGWYERQFAGWEGARSVGEASTTYTKYPRHKDVPKRMAEHLPDARLIYLLRHPIERIRSHYLHRVATGGERVDINQAVIEKPFYVDFSRYAMQMEQYLDHYPHERIMIVRTEELRNEQTSTLEKLYSWLGVDPKWTSGKLEHSHLTAQSRGTYPRVVHKLRQIPGGRAVAQRLPGPLKRLATKPFDPSQYSGTGHMSEEVRSRLEQLLAEDVQRLRTYMPPDFDGWGIA